MIDGKQAIFFSLLNRRVNRSKEGLCIKQGRGQEDRDKGTGTMGRVSVGTCDSGTRDEGLGDIKYDSGDVGRQIQGRGNVNEYCKNRR